MKQYVIDQLREKDFYALQDYLDGHAEEGALPGIYWVPLPETLYEGLQHEHKSCQPFYFAVNLDRNAIKFEMLVRTRRRMRCGCIQYATHTQREYIIAYADRLFETLSLVT
ncbi:MAG: hypothetical protein ACLFVT_07345 [Syntrophobacteria bacterium]